MSSSEDEISDAEILKEIQEEEEEAARMAAKLEAEQQIINSQLNNNNNNNGSFSNSSTENGSQLTRFQETIITTGSEVSLVLIAILSIIFIIQCIRKMIKSYYIGKTIDNNNPDVDVLSSLQPKHADDIEVLTNAKSYPVYTTPLNEREEFYKLLQTGNANQNDLRNLLLRRAVTCIEKFNLLNRDSAGIRKNWMNDMLPKDIWDDFQNAHQEINHEFQSIIRDNQSFNFHWGSKYSHDIISCARDEWEKKMESRRIEYQAKLKNRAKLQQQQQQQQQYQSSSSSFSNNDNNNNNNNNNNNDIPSSSAPDDRNFGSGFKTGFFNKKKGKNGIKANNLSGDGSGAGSNGADVQPGATQQVRQRKGKRRLFKGK